MNLFPGKIGDGKYSKDLSWRYDFAVRTCETCNNDQCKTPGDMSAYHERCNIRPIDKHGNLNKNPTECMGWSPNPIDYSMPGVSC